jgi:uncharacterized membrane protein
MAEAVPVGAPAPRIRTVELERPWAWLASGWRDLIGAPVVSLAYGVLFALIGWALTFGLWWLDAIYLILPLGAGFLILGPILAVGLYEVSRRRQRGEPATLAAALAAFRVNSSQIAFMGVTLLLLFLAWIRLAVLMDRPDEHVVTAIATSFKAVLDNPATMLFWAVLIVVFVGAGLVTFYLGLIVALPLIGYASWHAYRDIVEF